jgi:hypothetical protein
LQHEQILQRINDFIAQTPETIILPEKDLMKESFDGHNFMIISYSSWNTLLIECEEALKDMPSTLIIKHENNCRII